MCVVRLGVLRISNKSNKLSLKERLKFGRKSFGALLKSPSSRFKLLPTPAPKSNKNPNSGLKWFDLFPRFETRFESIQI